MALPATSITVNDGAATPVAQTFSIVDRTGLASVFRNMAAALVRGSQAFKHEIRLASSATAANRALMSLAVPREGVVNGSTAVVRTSTFKLEANYSPDSPVAERKSDLVLFLNLASQADVVKASTDLVSLS